MSVTLTHAARGQGRETSLTHVHTLSPTPGEVGAAVSPALERQGPSTKKDVNKARITPAVS